ncbi:MAG: lipid II flippase Amj family protein [Clostridia bacterium]|nr:lipid II flippase Amj family protein [Clostridia bacterium]
MERVLLVGCLTGIIHLINTLIYSVRVAGVKTGRLATALTLFSVIFLLSSTANTIQGPFLGSIVDAAINSGDGETASAAYQLILTELSHKIRIIIIFGTLGSVLGLILIPCFVRVFVKVIVAFEHIGSVSKLLIMLLFSPRELFQMAQKEIPRIEVPQNIQYRGLPRGLLVTNVLITGIFTIGVLASVYAGALYPDFRSTTNSMASIVNGIAQILLATVVDPVAARVTDQALRGVREEAEVMQLSRYLALTRIGGTLLAQVLFLPAAYLIVAVAHLIT